MARNVGKKRGAQPRPAAARSSGGSKALLPFIGGLVLGLAIAGGIYLLKLLPTSMELRERELACEDAADKPDTGKTVTAEAPAEKKPVTFDFYNMLTKQQTVAPAAGRNTTSATPPPAVPPPLPPVAATPAAPVAQEPAQVPAVATAAAAPPPAPAPTVSAAVKPAARYSLQAGSFATRAEADRRRGELVFSGLDANVQQVTTEKGEIRFRVIAGPFGDEGSMKKAQQLLAGKKIDTLPVRLK